MVPFDHLKGLDFEGDDEYSLDCLGLESLLQSQPGTPGPGSCTPPTGCFHQSAYGHSPSINGSAYGEPDMLLSVYTNLELMERGAASQDPEVAGPLIPVTVGQFTADDDEADERSEVKVKYDVTAAVLTSADSRPNLQGTVLHQTTASDTSYVSQGPIRMPPVAPYTSDQISLHHYRSTINSTAPAGSSIPSACQRPTPASIFRPKTGFMSDPPTEHPKNTPKTKTSTKRPSSGSSTSEEAEVPDWKKEKRREQNRRAADRCRRNRKLREEELEKEFEATQRDNKRKKLEIQVLHRRIVQLTSILTCHEVSPDCLVRPPPSGL